MSKTILFDGLEGTRPSAWTRLNEISVECGFAWYDAGLHPHQVILFGQTELAGREVVLALVEKFDDEGRPLLSGELLAILKPAQGMGQHTIKLAEFGLAQKAQVYEEIFGNPGEAVKGKREDICFQLKQKADHEIDRRFAEWWKAQEAAVKAACGQP